MVSKKSSCKIQAKYERLSLRKSSENQNEKRKKLRKFKTFFFPTSHHLLLAKLAKDMREVLLVAVHLNFRKKREQR